MTVKQWLSIASQQLETAGITSARLDALILLEDVMQTDRAWLLAHDDTKLGAEQLQKLSALLSRREGREPLAYIRQKAEFYGHTFFVDKRVLIPRPESEAIVDLVTKLDTILAIATIIDMGTGSGCLAISAKLALPHVTVIGLDISRSALQVARKNAQRLGAKIKWQVEDLLSYELPETLTLQPYILMANLPYVPDGLITSPEIHTEPAIALFSGHDGLNHYQELFSLVSSLSHKPAAIITESLEDQHSALEAIANRSGFQVAETTELVQCFVPIRV